MGPWSREVTDRGCGKGMMKLWQEEQGTVTHITTDKNARIESVRREGAPDPATPSGRTVSGSLSKQTTVPELGLVFLFPLPFSDRKINLFYFVE